MHIQSRPRIEGGKSYKKTANKVLIAVALFEKFDNFVHNELFLKIVLYICSGSFLDGLPSGLDPDSGRFLYLKSACFISQVSLIMSSRK